ncbi:putative aminotransferase family protein (LolT) [Aspergillus homomorphus CBS 101889]|uniref:Putative aminotransferase family protein n=1 Tax=Aspergillus homomorphus (strain CBS 101889) TaxID=1450537 RepID=A0A395HT99_ASPHC|nr:putative aminotransferase family protein [Aspergillus homomorphus CBS 101889]RAL10633.1 putative aminotransferase family protein [Aspergillus homomorphus CBS 101889]
MPPTPFGAPMREHFQLDPNYKNLNHGSFGTHPTQITQTLQTYQKAADRTPDAFLRYTQPSALTTARTTIAAHLNCAPQDLVFVKNATTGIATILHNLLPSFSPGDTLIYFSTIYGAVENGIFSLLDRVGGGVGLEVRKIEYGFPASHAEIVGLFRGMIRTIRAEGKRPRIAVFESVVSLPGVRFPFEALIGVCGEEGVWSCVDAAHGVGMIPLDFGREFGGGGGGGEGTEGAVAGVDFLTSNCHKWLYTPRSAAILYVKPALQPLLRTTLPTSWGYIPPPSQSIRPSLMASTSGQSSTKTPFESLFEFVATADDTPYLCVPAALDFRREVCGGETAIYAYLEELAVQAADLVAEALGTEVLGADLVSSSSSSSSISPGHQGGENSTRSPWRRCAMNNVRLPVRVGDSSLTDKKEAQAVVPADRVPAVVDWMQRRLVEDYGTFVPVFAHAGWLWVRLSAQVYLDRTDFEWLVPVLKELVGRVEGELLE